jgi:virulence factor Mce-like protein
MRRRRAQLSAGDLAGNPILVGTVALLVTLVAVFLAYNANRGLPFVPTYQISVDLPDAAELVRGDDVRIGGGRVGQVLQIKALPAPPGGKPYARLKLALEKRQEPLPMDTTVQVRPGSILGSKYVALSPGHSKKGLPAGGILPLRQSRSVVDLTEAFNIFDKDTTRGIRGAVGGLGTALASRGPAINELIASTRTLLPPLERVSALLAAQRTDLPGFIQGLAATTGALVPVSSTLGALIDHSATTLKAIDAAGNSLGRTIDELPPTESVGTHALDRIAPVLDDAVAITHAIRPGTRLLPTASRRLAAALEAGTPTLRLTSGLTGPLTGTLKALDRLALDPAASGAVRLLTATVTTAHDTLLVLTPAQTVCNVNGLWARNVSSTISQGDAAGGWLRTILVLGSAQMLQSASPDPDLHVTLYPNENANECEAGNEPYSPGQLIGNPPGNQSTTVDQTAPPPGVLERARRAGLLTPVPGATR